MGKVEKAVLHHLTEARRPLSVRQLASFVFGHDTPDGLQWWYPDGIHVSPAEVASVKRALRRLQTKTALIDKRGGEETDDLWHLWMGFPAFHEKHKSVTAYWALNTVWEYLEDREARDRDGREARRAEREAHEKARSPEPDAVGGIDAKIRDKLAKVLGMLGSAHEGERLAAARLAEELRQQLGTDWASLLK